jgi:hypothetical protein
MIMYKCHGRDNFLFCLKENEKIVRGEYKATEETKKQELFDPVTMCYGDIPEKNG